MEHTAPLAAVLADLLLGEPPARAHPTVWMGRLIGAGRRMRRNRYPGPSLVEGALLLAGGAALSVGAGIAAERLLRLVPRSVQGPARGLVLKPALSLRALLHAGAEVERALAAGDLSEARRRLAWHLVSRDTADLSASEVVGATIESLAENLGDALVAPLLAFRAGGLGGAYLYRFVNTCDAMLGYRTPELEWFGKASARADDVLNLVPARLSALLIAAAAPLVGGDPREALHRAFHDARRTPSPNAGWPMAAAAGALGVRLTKRGTYDLNSDARDPGPADLRRTLRLIAAAGGLAALLVRA